MSREFIQRRLSCDVGSCETERLGEEDEASDCMDWERCRLRVFVVSCVVKVSELDGGDGGVRIAFVVKIEVYKNACAYRMNDRENPHVCRGLRKQVDLLKASEVYRT